MLRADNCDVVGMNEMTDAQQLLGYDAVLCPMQDI